MKVLREIVGAESVTVVTWPVQIPGCFLILWLLVWSPGVVLAAHHFLTAETIKSSGPPHFTFKGKINSARNSKLIPKNLPDFMKRNREFTA